MKHVDMLIWGIQNILHARGTSLDLDLPELTSDFKNEGLSEPATLRYVKMENKKVCKYLSKYLGTGTIYLTYFSSAQEGWEVWKSTRCFGLINCMSLELHARYCHPLFNHNV